MAVVVVLSPKTPATINHGATKQFTALVTGHATTTVTWSIVSGVGSISAGGLYTASASGAVTVKATANADSTTNDTFSFTVATVAISHAAATVIADENLQMSAQVTGAANTAVTWTKISGNGAITSGGLYTAGLIGSDVVRGTSVEDGTKTVDVTITVAHAAAGARKVHVDDRHNDFIQHVVRAYLNRLHPASAEYILGQAALDSLKSAF